MQAVPECYPVTIEFSGQPGKAITEGVVSELYSAGQTVMTESGNAQTQLRVVARSESMARERAERVTKGVVVEVGSPSALQDYTKRKALPYRRSFVMSRFKRGRFSQQGGAGASVAAALPDAGNVPSTGVGIPMGESVDSLMGPEQVDEASAAQRSKRERRRRQFRAKHPATVRKMRIAGKKAGRKGSVKNARRKTAHRNRRKTARFKGKTNPHYEDVNVLDSTPEPTVESVVSGYKAANALHTQLMQAPSAWLESTRGRKTIIDSIHNIRLAEGNVPANALEAAYLDGDYSTPLQEVAVTGTANYAIMPKWVVNMAREYAERKGLKTISIQEFFKTPEYKNQAKRNRAGVDAVNNADIRANR